MVDLALTGVYLLSISCGGCQVAGSPFKVAVPEPLKVPEAPHDSTSKAIVAIGSGLDRACINQVAEFIIDGAPAGLFLAQLIGNVESSQL